MKDVELRDVNAIRLSDQEEKLIRVIRGLEFGEIRIVVTDHKPIRIEEIKKSIKL